MKSLKTQFEELATMGRQLGLSPTYVQGGGGNVSVKLNNKLMAIKSSGLRLDSITADSGFSIVKHDEIIKYLSSEPVDEISFVKSIRSCVWNQDQARPSIETGFHSFLRTWVAHTHSVYVNVLTCSLEGKSIAQKLFSEAAWVPYCSPGMYLTLEIMKRLRDRDVRIIFLENHGVIITGDSCNEVIDRHERVNEKVIDFLGLEKISATILQGELSKIGINHFLFPDQVVFSSEKQLVDTLPFKETMAAYHYILNEIYDKKLKPKFLDSLAVDYLLGMESEKYRIKRVTK